MHAAIKCLGLKNGTRLTEVDFLNMDGTLISTKPLASTASSPKLYLSAETIVPDVFFQMQVGIHIELSEKVTVE